MTMLSGGTPMFLMGEEVGAQKAYTYDKFYEEKEDLPGLRDSTGAFLWKFYQDIIRFRLGSTAVRSANIDVFHANDDARVVAFRRWDDTGELLIVSSLNNSPFNSPGYLLSYRPLGDWGWQECLNSDAGAYGGRNVGNLGATLHAITGQLNVVIPANGVVVFSRMT